MYKVSLKKCGGYESPELDKLLEESVNLIGGIARFVPKNAAVLIKLNFIRVEADVSLIKTANVAC
jgi:uncharacterized protein (DUF362 family)